MFDWNVFFDTRTNPQDSYTVYIPHFFSIKAIANGTASINKPVELHIIICGYEVITPASGTILRELIINQNPGQVFNTIISARNLFETNDTDCRAIDFDLRNDVGDIQSAPPLPAGSEKNVFLEAVRDPRGFI